MKGNNVLMGVVAAALLLAACQSASVAFKSEELRRGSYVTARGLLFKPQTDGRQPAVMLLHACGGMRRHVTQDWPTFLTGLGYVVMAVDTYGPRGVSSCRTFPGGNVRGQTTQAQDAGGALKYLVAQPFVDPNRIAVMGYSTGAIAINRFIVGRMFEDRDGPRFAAAVSFYGRCEFMPTVLFDPVPTLLITAEYDELIRPLCVRAANTTDWIELTDIKSAYHGFDAPEITTFRTDSAGNRMLYSAAATRRAQEAVRAFLAKRLGG